MPPGEEERPADEGGWFVGRHDVRKAIAGFLDDRGSGHRLHATGTWGIGKSVLVDQIEKEAAEANVFVIRCGGYVPRAAPTGDDPVPTMKLLQNVDAFARLLSDASDRAGTAGFGDVAKRIVEARRNVAEVRSEVPQSMEAKVEADEIEVSEHSKVVEIVFESKEPLHKLEATIDEERAAVVDAFASQVNHLGAAGGAVVLVDEFDHLRGHIMARWLLELLGKIDKAVIMLTTRAPDAKLEPYRPERRHDLQPFSADEVREYLGHRLGARAVTDELVERVLRFSAGLPQAVGMAADLVAQRTRTGGDRALGDLELEEATPATTDLLAKIVGELDDPDVVKLLRQGRLARRIDLDLANWLLFGTQYEKGTPESARASAAFTALQDYSFIEAYDTTFEETGRFSFHEHIRRAVPPAGDRALQVDEEAVHETLADYFEHRRDRYEAESDGSAYHRWFRNEDHAWQSWTSEWLYHSGMLRRPEARQTARLELARIFLDAFWWWGCYVPFPFCAELLDDWELTQPAAERAWSDPLRELLRSYPLGYEKLDAGNWPSVTDAMRTLRKLGELERRVPQDDASGASEREKKAAANRRRVRALTSLFRAHSFRFQTKWRDLAVPEYKDALAYFSDDVVAMAWTTFELAELNLELGDAEGALAGIREAASVANEEGDYELLANLHRLRGDVALARKADAAAIGSSAGKAVVRSFAFLLEVPDQYTQAFYREQRERLAARLVELATRRSAADAEAAAAQAVEELAPLRALLTPPDPSAVRRAIQRRNATDLAGLLMPSLPPIGDAALADRAFEPSARRAQQAVDTDPADAELAAES